MSDTAPEQPLLTFDVYRWPGISPEEFREHYVQVHAKIGMRLPGVIWYESFLNRNPTREWPVIGSAPVPDAFVVMKFESPEALANVKDSPEWAEAAQDDIGFCSHFQVYEVDRYTWVSEGSR
ncbi:MAG TPA: EthD domain-containing protein [Pseudonocardia sp.]|jgi:hypothetical protein|nr:EthD domain-containing protein [Pseudonocardia sp.]